MIRLKYLTPIAISIKMDETYVSHIRNLLSFKNTSAEYEYNRLKKSKWMSKKYGEQWYRKALEEARGKINRCLLMESPAGYWTYSGLANIIEREYSGNVVIENDIKYPEPALLPWHIPMKNKLRYYQIEAVKKLLEAKHGAIELCTGSGKSSVATQIIKELGLRTVITAPSESIANQLYDNLKINFGKKKVGFFGGSKKESDKQIVVAIAQSLVRVEEGSEHWNNLSKAKVFIFDESQYCPASTMEKICFGLLSGVPYRFFMSATQIRNDGQKLLLDAIIGPVVHQYSLEKAISDGHLVSMKFKMVKIKSELKHMADDPNEITREHLYYNPKVVSSVIELCNNAVSILNRKVLILIDEIEQFWHISNKLQYKWAFAHGGNLNQKQKDMVPEEFRNPDNNKLVEQFNAGSFPILIGTSCVSVGTDIRATDFIIYWQGGKSEIQIKQAIGRGTRLYPGKNNCIVVDFDVYNCSVTHRHALERKKIYEEIGKFEYIEV